MKKKTAMTLLFLAAAAAVIAIAAMAGMSKHKQVELQQQQEQQQIKQQQEEQQQIETYRDNLEDTFDALLETEDDLQQTTDSESDNQREMLIDMIQSTGDVIEQLSTMETPETLAQAHEHFINAADSYSEMSKQAIDALSDKSTNSEELALSIMTLLPDAVEAFDEVQSGIDELEAKGVDVPESAKQFTETLGSLLNSDEITP